ncbi:MAG: hypothetical protein MZW92_19745 [Comamonadaceae bacterium]|nr:hypothetical protein [Comamonadaceae bacterium]
MKRKPKAILALTIRSSMPMVVITKITTTSAASRAIGASGVALNRLQHAGLAVGGDDHRDRYQPARGDDHGRVGGDRHVHRAEPCRTIALGALPWMPPYTKSRTRGRNSVKKNA